MLASRSYYIKYMNINKIIDTNFKWQDRQNILMELPHKACVKFTIFCAEQVVHLIDDKYMPSATKVIEVAKLFVEGKATSKECEGAAIFTTPHIEYTHNDAYNVIYGAAFTATTVSSSSYATAYSRICTEILNPEITKQEQMNYLRQLVIENLSEEERDNWLLIVSV
jgi:hypothetical protein